MKTDLRSTNTSPAVAHFSERSIYVATLLIFGLAATVTIYFSQTMTGSMRMPGRWTMSMMWMTMPGQSWFRATLVFAGMWLAMMITMMLPSTLPILFLYRRATAFRGESHLALLTFVLGAGYFLVWLLFGVVVYAMGRSITNAAMKWVAVSRTVPFAAAVALILAGSYQLTSWKMACLKHCRDPLELVAHHLGGGSRGAFRLGLHHGAFCAACCWALMLIQLVLGVMSLTVMVGVAAIIAFEKLFTRGETVARIIGTISVLAGIVQAVISVIGLKGA
jgi:predicted metal-binding membrane protein